MAKKMKCLYGDGCLIRLTDNSHEDKYIHAESYMPRCSEEDCPIYRKVYDFIIGEQKVKTPEIKAAERHVASYYHPPIRSRSVTRSRPRAISHYREVKAEVPPLDFRSMSAPEDSRMKSPPMNATTVPHRGTITVSPKRKRSRGEEKSEITDKIQMIQSDIEQIKKAILKIQQALALKT